MTLLYTDPLFLSHETGRHPECPERLRAVVARLEASRLEKCCAAGTYQPLDEKDIAQVHDPHMFVHIKQLCQQPKGRIDADTIVCPASLNVAQAAAGACVAAVDGVLGNRKSAIENQKSNTALCLVRPPGHHATPTKSMGFCLFNNVALAAHHAKMAYGLTRILIVDWDVHHGNGTQDIFYDDPEVFFYSIHRYPFYPGTGAAEETGQGRGLGFTLNVPIKYGMLRTLYHEKFTQALEQAAEKIKPELVLISAGFDAHAQDPVGSLSLEVEDFVALTKQVLEVAKTHAGGRVVSCLEGGYNVNALAECVEAHLRELVDADGEGGS